MRKADLAGKRPRKDRETPDPDRSSSGTATISPYPEGESCKRWIGISVSCSAEYVDDLAAMIAETFSVGVEITNAGVRFYLLLGSAAAENWEPKLDQLLEEFRGIYGRDLDLAYASDLVVDEGWADRWKEHFKPLRVGHRFIICPTWEEPEPRSGDLVIRIDPGQAFGTGHHETTRLCLEWLDDHDRLFAQRVGASMAPPRKPSFLDVGTGTGILAMGATLLGWSEVVAVDNDPEAVRVAAENVRINGLETRIRLSAGSVDQVQGQFGAVMANIQAQPLIRLAAALVARLSSTGRLVLSGILLEQRGAVIAAYGERGMRLISDRTAGEWCLLEFAAKAAR